MLNFVDTTGSDILDESWNNSFILDENDAIFNDDFNLEDLEWTRCDESNNQIVQSASSEQLFHDIIGIYGCIWCD